ncbi:hypothetical protein EV702DRAFT_1279634, partial [Suillus placidus]
MVSNLVRYVRSQQEPGRISAYMSWVISGQKSNSTHDKIDDITIKLGHHNMSGLLDVAHKKKCTVRRRAMPAPTQTMRLHADKVSVVAFFKDGRRVVTGSWDYTLRICDIQKGVVVGGPFVGHSNKVFSVAVSPDDRR